MNLLTICLAAYSLLVTIVAVSAIREANRLDELLGWSTIPPTEKGAYLMRGKDRLIYTIPVNVENGVAIAYPSLGSFKPTSEFKDTEWLKIPK